MGKKQNKGQVPPAAEPQNKKPSTSKPPKKSNSSNTVAPPTHKDLEEALKALDVRDLKQRLAHSQTLFPDNPSFWVEALAEYLHLNLTAPETEPTHCSCAHDYPYCLTGQELRDVIEGLIRGCRDVLPRCFDHCVYAMLTGLDRLSGKGRRRTTSWLQSLHPGNFKGPTHNSHPTSARVWLGIMLPVLGVKSLSAYVIAYLDLLLLHHPDLTMGFDIIGPKEFFLLLYFAFMPEIALSSSLQGQLRRLLLLNHLLKSWKVLPPKLRKNLEETIQSFRVTIEEMSDTIETPELHECIKLCQNLQVKMRGRGLPWSKLLMVLLVKYLAGFMAYVVISHGSFTDSSTARYLHNSGVTAVSQQAWGKITVYSKHGFSFFFSWVETNTLYYYSESVRVLRPLVTQAMEKSKAASVFISYHTILWEREKMPLVIEWVCTNTLDSVFQVLAYVRELLRPLYLNDILPALAFLGLDL
ncbi:unnamed protein product [Pleuronectes platessa]|uniref:Transmembrane protein 214 n=1 Tax=Pleuronectes platessa TaxID=8262 RepID=A0A9N7VWB5_PLEPL|nr:unnamed protein product [Pleuronectes platessa]